MKSLLVAVEPGDGLQPMLRMAAMAAARLGACAEGAFVSANPPTVLVASGDGLAAAAAHEMIEEFQAQERERAALARDAFLAAMTEAGLPLERPGRRSMPCACWHDTMANGLEELARLAALYDLTVIGRPSKGHPIPSMAAVEAVLFSGGRPLLIVPPAAPDAMGRTVVVAWKNSPETARTVGFAMPVLALAAAVHVLSVDTADGVDASAEVLCEHLTWNGIPARTVHRQAMGRTLGQAILEEADALGADLLVKGAYTQSRISQLIFGGATRHILSHAGVPVFMAH
jgi:nucleotide-binding universal stress UspA family protein